MGRSDLSIWVSLYMNRMCFTLCIFSQISLKFTKLFLFKLSVLSPLIFSTILWIESMSLSSSPHSSKSNVNKCLGLPSGILRSSSSSVNRGICQLLKLSLLICEFTTASQTIAKFCYSNFYRLNNQKIGGLKLKNKIKFI